MQYVNFGITRGDAKKKMAANAKAQQSAQSAQVAAKAVAKSAPPAVQKAAQSAQVAAKAVAKIAPPAQKPVQAVQVAKAQKTMQAAQVAAKTVAKSAPPVAQKAVQSAQVASKSAAQTGDFLGGSGKPISMSTPALSAAQQAANVKAAAATAQTRLQQAANTTASSNAAYQRERAVDLKWTQDYEKRMSTEDSPEGRAWRARDKAMKSTAQDWGLIPMGIKVLATGAAVIASAGAAAGVVGLTAGGASLASAAAADKLLAAAGKGGEIAKQANDAINTVKAAASKGDAVAKQALATLESVAKKRAADLIPSGVQQTIVSFGVKTAGDIKGAMASADKLLGDPSVKNAQQVISNTKALAALGDPAAKRGLEVLTAVQKIRTEQKAPLGKSVIPQVPGASPVVQKTSADEIQELAVAAVSAKPWYSRLLSWLNSRAA